MDDEKRTKQGFRVEYMRQGTSNKWKPAVKKQREFEDTTIEGALPPRRRGENRVIVDVVYRCDPILLNEIVVEPDRTLVWIDVFGEVEQSAREQFLRMCPGGEVENTDKDEVLQQGID